MRRAALLVAAVVAVLVGYAALDVADRVPGILTVAPAADPSPASSSEPEPPPTAEVPGPAPAGAPLPTAGASSPLPSAAGVAAALTPLLQSGSLGRAVGVTVRDAATGAHLFDLDPDRPLIPASVLKLASAVGVVSAFPPGSVLTTRTVQGASATEVLLVAGGDTLLEPGRGRPGDVAGRAGLADLAAATAASLRGHGVSSVTVALDAGDASSPVAAPTWPSSFLASGITSPVAPIGLSSQRATPGHPGPRDPGAAALAAFTEHLSAAGIPATVDPRPAAAAPDAAVLGSVDSAPVADQLALALVESDNGLTESLARRAALAAGHAGGFADVAAYVRTVLGGLGVDITGMATVDASGLSGQNRVPARVLGDVLALAADDRVPGLRDVFGQLAVAGLDGTLAGRFDSGSPPVGAGIVRAKTGTLTGVNSLAGTLVTADGRLLTFALLAEGGAAGPARTALDAVATTLAGCGCR